jgi:hypothetical protein
MPTPPRVSSLRLQTDRKSSDLPTVTVKQSHNHFPARLQLQSPRKIIFQPAYSHNRLAKSISSPLTATIASQNHFPARLQPQSPRRIIFQPSYSHDHLAQPFSNPITVTITAHNHFPTRLQPQSPRTTICQPDYSHNPLAQPFSNPIAAQIAPQQSAPTPPLLVPKCNNGTRGKLRPCAAKNFLMRWEGRRCAPIWRPSDRLPPARQRVPSVLVPGQCGPVEDDRRAFSPPSGCA